MWPQREGITGVSTLDSRTCGFWNPTEVSRAFAVPYSLFTRKVPDVLREAYDKPKPVTTYETPYLPETLSKKPPEAPAPRKRHESVGGNFHGLEDIPPVVEKTSVKHAAWGQATYSKCAHQHPPLKVGEYTVYGGAAASPIIHTADIYVSFERYAVPSFPVHPWDGKALVVYLIPDGGVPNDLVSFHKLLDYLQKSMAAGKTVHLGCIGGHGRTGLVLAALVAKVTGTLDAITYVRENYCKKAVETPAQVAWLAEHFNIVKVKASRGFGDPYSGGYGRASGLQEFRPLTGRSVWD